MQNKPAALTVIIISAAIVIAAFVAIKVTRSGKITLQKDPVFTDEELLTYAQSSFDKAKMMSQDMTLGTHNEARVRVTFPCADMCPQNTTRIIRYDVDVSRCSSVGGVVKALAIPSAAGLTTESFCFPKVLTENNIYQFFGE